MKTFYEIIGEKKYHELTTSDRDAIQVRQTQLVIEWQDSNCEMERKIIIDELMASLKGLIYSKSVKEADKSYSVEREDFEGIIQLVLAESLVDFDRTKNKPFTPVFILNVNNHIKMMYRDKSYDIFDTLDDRLEDVVASDFDIVTLADTIIGPINPITECMTDVYIEQLLNRCFGDNEMKKIAVCMTMQGYKRNEIVAKVITKGKSISSVEKSVNRAVTDFKEYCLNLC